MKMKGKIINWNHNKAFGFIAPNGGGEDIFIHKTVLSNRNRTPKINDIITFSLAKDQQGRFCAKNATFSGEKLKQQQVNNINRFSLYLSLLFIGLLTAGYLLNHLPIKLPLAYLIVSLITFIAYALDKSKAQRGVWRTPESTLHFLALIGGWPGAAIAQQVLRHKSKKKEFLVIFWFTVIINSAALYWLLTPQGKALLELFK